MKKVTQSLTSTTALPDAYSPYKVLTISSLASDKVSIEFRLPVVRDEIPDI